MALLLLIIQLLVLDLSRLSSWGLPIVVLLCIVYHAWWIAPYTGLFPEEVKNAGVKDEQRVFRILAANVLMPNRNADDVLRLVRENEPDILIALETDSWWEEQLKKLEKTYPYTIKCPLDNRYGMHVYSRLRLIGQRIAFLVDPDIPSTHSLVVLPSGDRIRVHFLHPAPPSPKEAADSSERDAELIIVGKSVAESKTPVIVAGDLNDVAWSATTRLFRKISGLLDPRIGRGMYNTFHADYWFLRWPLDHLFHTEHFTLADIRRLRLKGSDHFALLTELAFEPERGWQQKGLEADLDDLAWADKKARDEGVDESDVPRPEAD
jgi:endonuclease/exonuclease/phosphatase (EEP) superfamily protein YafD